MKSVLNFTDLGRSSPLAIFIYTYMYITFVQLTSIKSCVDWILGIINASGKLLGESLRITCRSSLISPLASPFTLTTTSVVVGMSS